MKGVCDRERGGGGLWRVSVLGEGCVFSERQNSVRGGVNIHARNASTEDKT